MVLVGKAVIAQGGGPTAVINQSLVGVITEAKKYAQVTGIYGAINGVEGIVKEEFIDLSQETTVNLEKIAKTPSSALLSTRVKPDVEFCKKIFEVFKAHDVRFFFYIGGNDSSDTVRILNDQAKVEGYDFRAVHIPKTIDNDLMCNDHTPGYASAAKFVMQAFSGINLDMRSLAGVYIGVVMGRNAGFLTAAAGMASKRPEDGPHLVYLPETPFCMDKFITDVKEVYDRLGRCVIAVSEGIVDETGLPIVTKYMENIERDDHGNISMSGNSALGDVLARLIKDKLKIKRVRADTFGYIQRCFLGCVSEVDQQESREVGEKAVHFAVAENKSGSICIKRTGDYLVDYELIDFCCVAALTKKMPSQFINEEGNNITPAFKDYLRPLLGRNITEVAYLSSGKIPKIINK